MSTEQTTNDVTVDTNLDDFAAKLFGESEAKPSDDAKSEVVEKTVGTEDDATTEETDTHSADDGATEEDEAEEADDLEEATDEDDKPNKAPPKKDRLQERINELTAARREAERERDDLRRKLEEKDKPPVPAPKEAAKVNATDSTPKPNDTNEDGTDKYPLGEFDPRFLQDTVKYMLNEQMAAQQAEAQRLAEQREVESARMALQDSWEEKLVDVQERYPDYREKGETLLATLGTIEPAYAEYLTTTLMEMDAGTDVFYYLSNNPTKAQEIVNAGPRKATIALAKLEAELVGSTPVTKVTKAKTTNTSAPPPRLKGSAVSKGSVNGDTDDLDAFARELFKKK